MISLEDYLRDEYQDDKQQLERTHRVIQSVLPVFEERFTVQKEGVTTWPYRLEKGVPQPLKRFSDSTHSMILFALDAILRGIDRTRRGTGPTPVLFPSKLRAPKLNVAGIPEVVDQARRDLIRLLLKRRGTPLVTSTTFGDNDPMTLTWIAELLLHAPATDRHSNRCKTRVRQAAIEVCRRGSQVLKWGSKSVGRQSEIPHAFLWLRCRHLAKVTALLRRSNAKPLETRGVDLSMFEDVLHQQMGYFTIPDSRFDPAVLVFAVEGALQFDPHALSDSTLESVFRTLEHSQKSNPYWRPVTPFLANSQGMVLFPVSVEISNSLLRTYEILHGARRPTHFSQLESLLRRYVQWLLARAERLSYSESGGAGLRDRQALGWHSEHVNAPGTIHMWETSQVLLFLVHYASLLQRKIAAEGLAYAGLALRETSSIKRAPDYWQDEPLDALSRVGARRNTAVDETDRHYAVLRKIHDSFVVKRTSSSLLLYGPPGTGKTTLAEQMAVSLGQPLLIITVSDFLAGGAAEVEARAKGVFQILQEQEDIVILFDEIDQFLLDRNGEAYRNQTGIFQFLTPGMLTKFQDLKDQNSSIFIVATNYEERIDSAIKRQGRFDQRLLLSLPDSTRRKEFVWAFLSKKLALLTQESNWPAYVRAANRNRKAKEVLSVAASPDLRSRRNRRAKTQFERQPELKTLLRDTVLFGYGDIKHLVSNALRISPGDTWDAIVTKLVAASTTVQPSVKLSAYSGRFKRPDEQTPFEEFAILMYLVGECGAQVDQDAGSLIREVYQHKNTREVLSILPGSERVRKVIRTAVNKVDACRMAGAVNNAPTT